MSDGAEMPLFARPDFQRVAGDTLRPGGIGLTRRAALALGLRHGERVLDLGSGPGATARLLAELGCRALALDLDAGFAARAAGPGVEAVVARAEALPLADACLDAVFCECVLSLSADPAKVLRETARVLRHGGRLALTDLYLRPGVSRQAEASSATGCAQHTPGCAQGARPWEEIAAFLAAAGFETTLREDHSRLLAELAGRLILSGITVQGLCDGGAGRPGYFLCLARKTQAQ